MEQIQHKFVEVQGLKLHLAEIGTGDKVVICLHGFPEIWYSWRHQMIALAAAGYRVIAPDHRGYGLSDSPAEPEKAKFADLISDIRSVLDSLDLPKVVFVAKDFGVLPAYYFALLHPDRVLGVVTIGVPFVPPGAIQYHKHLPEGFYFTRWKEPGRAEADFGRFDAKTVVRKIYTMFAKMEVPIASAGQEVLDLVDTSTTSLPAWFTEQDLEIYGSLYQKSGFLTALQVPYRSFDEEYDMPALEVKVPAMLIAGEKDYVLYFPGMEDYIRSGKVKDFVPDLETVFLPEGTHFVQEQSPEQVNQLILNFLKAKIWQ